MSDLLAEIPQNPNNLKRRNKDETADSKYALDAIESPAKRVSFPKRHGSAVDTLTAKIMPIMKIRAKAPY